MFQSIAGRFVFLNFHSRMHLDTFNFAVRMRCVLIIFCLGEKHVLIFLALVWVENSRVMDES